jgi:hypothetical protein
MPQPPITRHFDRDTLRVAALASAVSLLSLLYYFQHGQILLYGDAVAHINIARRVFDSQTPGLLQLGTVWLPLSHLLMTPFLLSGSLWQSGLGGSIPSMIAYVLGAVGVYRLTRGFAAEVGNDSAARVSAWMAAFVYAANPNLIYLQTTAMTEPLYLALFVWATVYFAESVRALGHDPPQKSAQVGAPLIRCGLCLAAAEFTRYDGWFLAVAIGAIVFAFSIWHRSDRAFRGSAKTFLVMIAVVPLLWLAYNAATYGNPLEFVNGPYSAKAIQQRSAALNPAQGQVVTAASYFLKSAELNMVPGNWGRLWLAASAGGLAFALWKLRACSLTFLLLCLPIAFYAFSIAYGGVPLYVPTWWPFTWYNVRYGLQLLPLFSVLAGVVIAVSRTARKPPQPWLAIAAFALVVISYASVWRVQALCLTEAQANSRTRTALESAVERTISALPPGSRFLMYLGDHVGIFQQTRIPLRRVVNEGNHRPWKKPADPYGLWERALANPPQYVDYVIAFDGDPVDRAADRTHLTLLSEIHTTGQPHARIYSAKPGGR